MAGAGNGGGRTATLNLMVGIFLKLLGFFVVLYSYTEISPKKAHQAEQSLARRFNVAVSLVRDRDDVPGHVTAPIQNGGRAFREINDQLKTQVDFLSTETIARDDTLVLRISPDTAENADFATKLADVLNRQNAPNYVYDLRIMTSGANPTDTMRNLGLFADRMVQAGYAARLITLGYRHDLATPVMELQIRQVRG